MLVSYFIERVLKTQDIITVCVRIRSFHLEARIKITAKAAKVAYSFAPSWIPLVHCSPCYSVEIAATSFISSFQAELIIGHM